MNYRWESEGERQREIAEQVSQRHEIEQRLLEAQDAKPESVKMPEQQVSDAAALRREASYLDLSEFPPEVKAEARLMQVDDRMDTAAKKLRQIEGLSPEKWQQMNTRERAWTLRKAGQEMGEVYQHPTPPLLETNMGAPHSLGSYGDGYRFDSESQRVIGSDYGIKMNTAGEFDRDSLFGDDPKGALHTYAHEFRHSYQREQVTRWEKPQFRHQVDDPEQTMQWSQNIKDYKEPPDSGLTSTDYERYQREYEAYRTQPVEEDAERFANELVKRVYG